MGPCHRGGNWDWDPDQRHSSSCHRAFFSCGSAIGNKGCISVEQIPADLQMLTHFTGPMLPNQLFVSQLEIFHGGNFCRSVFLVLLLQAAAAEAFLPLSSPPLPKGNSMGSPLLRPHAATKLSSPGGDGAWAITGSQHLQLKPKGGRSVHLEAVLGFKRLCGGEWLIAARLLPLNEMLC